MEEWWRLGEDEYRWPDDGPPDLRDELTPADVVGALYAPATLRLDNRTPSAAPTFLAVCAPIMGHRATETWPGDESTPIMVRLVVVVCVRDEPGEAWTIVGAREAGSYERVMWRKYTA